MTLLMIVAPNALFLTPLGLQFDVDMLSKLKKKKIFHDLLHSLLIQLKPLLTLYIYQ